MATVTKPILLNETYSEKMDLLTAALAGLTQGSVPAVTRGVSEGSISLTANTRNDFPTLTGALNITFAPAPVSLDNEWIFVIPQGETAQEITLPEIEWYLGIAPAFAAGSITEVRVHRVGDTYKGVWIA